MSILKKQRVRSRLMLKITVQERQIAELKLYIEAMKELLLEKRALPNGPVKERSLQTN